MGTLHIPAQAPVKTFLTDEDVEALAREWQDRENGQSLMESDAMEHGFY